jgi:hypothetical protein
MRPARTRRCSFPILLALAAPAAAQTLVGDTVQWWRHPQSTGVVSFDSSALVVTPAHEFQTVIIQPNLTSTINIEATSIRLDSITSFYSPYFNTGFDPTYFEIRDLDFVGEPQRYIAGVNVSYSTTISVEPGAPINWPNFSAANVTFTADSVRLSIGGYEFPAGSFVHVNLITAVPAPSAAVLLGLAGAVASRRRR